MKLELIGSLDKPTDLKQDKAWYKSEFRNQLDKLLGECHIARATVGKEIHLVAEVNKLGGVCDDCTAFHLSEVEHWDFYKVEGF